MNNEHQTGISLTIFGLPYDSNTMLEVRKVFEIGLFFW